MTEHEHILSMLGLAARGRNLTSGEDQVLDAVRSGKGRLVIVAGDASENTKKKFHDKCTYYDVPFRLFSAKEELGHAIGRQSRTNVCVLDAGLAKKISDLIDSNKEE
jgi:ribosomal protein L7Ae-like RNA K-turn-binding protein